MGDCLALHISIVLLQIALCLGWLVAPLINWGRSGDWAEIRITIQQGFDEARFSVSEKVFEFFLASAAGPGPIDCPLLPFSGFSSDSLGPCVHTFRDSDAPGSAPGEWPGVARERCVIYPACFANS